MFQIFKSVKKLGVNGFTVPYPSLVVQDPLLFWVLGDPTAKR